MLTDESGGSASAHTPYVFVCRACKSMLTCVNDTNHTIDGRKCVFVTDDAFPHKLFADCLQCGERHNVPNRPLYSRRRATTGLQGFLSPKERSEDPALERRQLKCPLCKNVSIHSLYSEIDNSFERDASTNSAAAVDSNLARERFVVRAICSFPGCFHTHRL